MVIPMATNEEFGPGFPRGSLETSPQLQRFHVPLYVIAACYGLLVLVSILTGNVELGNAPLWFIMLALSHSMASAEGNTCITNCVVPFTLFAIMTLFLDVFLLWEQLNVKYPPASDFFSWSCPFNYTWIISGNTTLYTAKLEPFKFGEKTKVVRPADRCAEKYWPVYNAALVTIVIVDMLAAFLGSRMLSAAMALARSQDGLPGLGGGARSPFTGFPRGGIVAPEEGGGGGPPDMAGSGRRGRTPRRQGPGSRGPEGFRAFQGEGARMSL